MNPTKLSTNNALLIIAYLIFFSLGIMSSILNVAWEFMHGGFGVEFDALGVLLLVSTFGGLLGTFFSGRLIGRLGLGRYLLMGSVLVALGLFGYVTAPTWGILLLVSFVTALGTSSYNAGLNLFVAAHFNTGRLLWLHAAYGVGLSISPTITTQIIEKWGLSWRLSYGIALVATLGVLALILFTRTRWTLGVREQAPGESGKRDDASLWETLHIPAVLLGMTVFFIFNGILGGVGQLSTTLLTARGIVEAGYWVTLYWGSFTAGRIIMGFIAHRINNGVLIRACLFGAAIGGVLLWQNASAVVNLVGLAVLGLSCAPLYPTLVAEAHRSVEPRFRAQSMGVQISSAAIGQALIPGAMAWLALHVSVDTVGAVAAFGMLGVLAVYQVARQRGQAVPAVV